MDYDVVIIGAGMSGLGAGIRLAQFDHNVCIIEKHNVYGGLNSFYTLQGRRFDVGLHALTNFVPPSNKKAPLSRLLRQLRIPRQAFDLREQHYSKVVFPGRSLRFDNDVQLLIDEVHREFPADIDRFMRHIEVVRAYNDLDLAAPQQSARDALSEQLRNPTLIDMLLCPLMYYGCSTERDMDYTQYVTMFKSIYLEGFARPRQGVRRIIAELVKRYRSCGGQFQMGCGVSQLRCRDGQVAEVELEDGSTVRARTVLSSAGYHETMRLCSDSDAQVREVGVGQMTFVESISVLSKQPADLGLDATIIFFNDAETFSYHKPETPIDPRSGVICCPNNYADHGHIDEGCVRLTSMANYDHWASLGEDEYVAQKDMYYNLAVDHAVKFIPEFRDHVIFRDMFTPRTIKHFTGHLNGAVYGSAQKRRDGTTHLGNLFICGTDQGFLGIIGALLSGISMANLHVLQAK